MEKQPERISVMVLEDNVPTLNLLCSYLSAFSFVDVTGSAVNANDFIEAFRIIRPTVVFLDIEIPGFDGMTTAAKLMEVKADIFIVFVTAHTQYAADAYLLDAVDYVIKPISRERIEKSLNKVRTFLDLKTGHCYNSDQQRLTVKNGHEIFVINFEDIFFIEKEFRKSVIHTCNSVYTTTETLGNLEIKLPTFFFRCHKSFIINTKKIESISPIAERIYKITFYGYPLTVTMGRQKMEELCSVFETA